MKFIEKYKQYGFVNFIQRLGLGVMARLGISINKWLVCTQDIVVLNQNAISIKDKFSVKTLTYSDFENSNRFDLDKLVSFKKRYEKESFKSFGVFDDKEELAYYCWISLKEFQFSKNLYQMNLTESQGLLFDAFCFSEFRGQKLHGFMNFYRLNKLLEFGKSEAVVVLLSQNTPARKSQKRAGFRCSKVITIYSVFGKKGHYVTNKKINL